VWPAGFAAGVALLAVGFVLAVPAVEAAGAIVAVFLGALWYRRARWARNAPEPTSQPTAGAGSAAAAGAAQTYRRSQFLEASTLGLGGVIGGLISLPTLGFAVLPAFLKQRDKARDLGPVSGFPEGEFVVATYMARPEQGEVSRRTAFVRNNGLINDKQSFTIISNHCAHLGCPVQPNTAVPPDHVDYKDVTLIALPSPPSGFGCPCHGGQYDTEGNVIAGPPVRALDRYAFSIRNDHLFIEEAYSVSHVEGNGSTARIHKYTLAFPGEHVDGPEAWLYPVQPPH
jgi:Rieske Fe-S protein